MLTAIIPKLPMRDKAATKAFYIESLHFSEIGDYGDYLLIRKDNIEIHFFLFEALDPLQNYGQVYVRMVDIRTFYQDCLNRGISIHPNGPLMLKPWGQLEFSMLDPDHNLLTFGESK